MHSMLFSRAYGWRQGGHLAYQRSVLIMRNHSTQIPESSKLSWMLLPTKKNTDAVQSTTDVLTKAGYIHQSQSGIYTLMPLAQRVVTKITQIITEEMERVGGQRMSMPTLLSPDAWKKTGRLESTGSELLTLTDRKGAQHILAPTHEEEVTGIVKSMVRSYRQYPLRLFQVTQKFRDETRPRAGLLRAREFIMKDMYSFDINQQSAISTFHAVEQAYRACFDRLGVPYVVAEADSGNIGGELSKEFHFVSAAGEDTVLTCKCGYAANEERARGRGTQGADVYEVEGSDERVVVPAMRRPNMLKIKQAWPDCSELKLERSESGGDVAGLGQMIALDEVCADGDYLVDAAVDGLALDKIDDFSNVKVGDWHTAQSGDACTKCSTGTLESQTAIEVGHIFYLGDKYSKALDLLVQHDGKRQPVQMGCYGIGVSRVLQAAAECSSSSRGLRWPVSIAPYLATLVPLDDNMEHAASVFATLSEICVNGARAFADNVIVDDRSYLSPGFKLHDAQLLGIPITVVLGQKFKQSGHVEVQLRVPRLELATCVAGIEVQGDEYEYKAFVHVDQLAEFLVCALEGQF
ncbi:hypothetical protein GGH96_002056 [Coemansia sp. RSA 1972]|nr:hypothetical protein GGH96_002056 [Coemansia sp. RSA 1972]